MADNYYVVNSYRTVRVLNANTVQDAEYITAQTSPTNIGFAYAMGHDEWLFGPPYTVLGAIAATLENLVIHDHVVSGVAAQDVDSNGLLADYSDVVVRYDRSAQGLPPLDGTVSIPIQLIVLLEAEEGIPVPPGTVTPSQMCEQEYERLQALAGA